MALDLRYNQSETSQRPRDVDMAVNKMVGALGEVAVQIVAVGIAIADLSWAEVETAGSTSEDLAVVDVRRNFFVEESVHMVGWVASPWESAGIQAEAEADSAGTEGRRSQDVRMFSEAVAEVQDMQDLNVAELVEDQRKSSLLLPWCALNCGEFQQEDLWVFKEDQKDQASRCVGKRRG